MRADSRTAHPDLRWRLRLLGAVEAHGAGQTITQWPTRATAALMARMALAPERAHAREELAELLWPGVERDVGRARLRQTLSTLRAMLEPPGPHRSPVIDADRNFVRLVPGAVRCDVVDLERRLRQGAAPDLSAPAPGELMPGYYDEWIVQERLRLASMLERSAEQVRGDAANSRAPRDRTEAGVSRVRPDDSDALPGYLTRSFGFEAPAAQLRDLVRTARLVTVCGPGGSGKTRLAVEVARSLRDEAAGGDAAPGAFGRVVFVALVACEHGQQVLEAVAEALRAAGAGDARTRICQALGDDRVLLVLDNAEQLQADAVVLDLLAMRPDVHVLVSSRRLLGLDGETTFELQGLPLPPADAELDGLAGNAAVALFADRARAVRADFGIGARNGVAIAELVRVLAGMPLAIELAASRVRSLTPQELLRHLREDAGTPMLDLLMRQRIRATQDARHASMRHMLDWSWCRLSEAQSSLLVAVSIFTAPASLETIACVAGGDAARVRDGLDELHDLSLVHIVREDGGPARYALLQPVREYAAEQGGAARAGQARERLREWLTARARQSTATQAAALAGKVAHVHDCFVQAPADGAYREALELAVAMRPYWDTDMLTLPDILALEAALPHVADDPALSGDALELLAFARLQAGFAREALVHAEAACQLPLDDRRRSLVLTRCASVRYGAGLHDEQIERLLDEALALGERCGDLAAQATVLRLQGAMVSNLHLDYASSEALMARAQRLWEQLGDTRQAYGRLRDRAVMWAWMGRNEEAVLVLNDCERAARAAEDWLGVIHVTRQLGRVLIRLRRWPDAAAAFRRSIRVAWDRQNSLELTVALLHLPEALVHDPARLEPAARLHGFARARWTRLFGELNRIEQREVRSTRLLLRLRLGPARAEALRLEGTGWSIGTAIAQVL